MLVIKFNPFPEEELLAKGNPSFKIWGKYWELPFLAVNACGETRQNCGIINKKISNLFICLNCHYYTFNLLSIL